MPNKLDSQRNEENKKDKVLIVEDELDIAKLIQLYLAELDVDSDICPSGKRALNLLTQKQYQLVMLDVMLPELNGLDLCRQLRAKNPLQAIMMLTSRSSETDRVLGLEFGADDYMTKPFSIRELQARVRTQLRRAKCIAQAANHTPEKLDGSLATCIGQLTVDHRCHTVSYHNKAIELTSTEFELLSFLGKHPDQVFSRSQLLDSVWGYHHAGYEHTVNSHINRLRNKLESDVTNPKIIQTVWGVGYKLNSAGVN